MMTLNCSLDVISSRSFKDGTDVLSLPLCNLVNLSMKQSLIIDQYKIAKLMLQLKKNALRETRKITDPSYLSLLYLRQ